MGRNPAARAPMTATPVAVIGAPVRRWRASSRRRKPAGSRRRAALLVVLGLLAGTLPIGLRAERVAAATAPAFRSFASSQGDAATIVVSKPAGVQPGDVLVAQIARLKDAATVTAPTGWVAVREDAFVGKLAQTIYSKVVGASDPTSYTFTVSEATKFSAAVAAYSGVNPTAPVNAHGGAVVAKADPFTAPSITTTTSDVRLVAFFGNLGPTAVTPPTGMTERWDFGTSIAVEAADQAFVGPGATGARTASFANAEKIAQVVALAPATGATTFVVNSTADLPDTNAGNGVCSTGGTVGGNPECTLRAAIQEANALPGADTIVVPAGTYTLTRTGAGENAASTGDLDITSVVTITGAGAASTIVRAGTTTANGIDRVVEVLAGANATITGTTIRNGRAGNTDGGGVSVLGTLTLEDAVVDGGSARIGAGVFATGSGASVTIRRSTFTGGSAEDGGGVAAVNSATALVEDSTLQANAAATSGGGLYVDAASATVLRSTFSGNSAGSSDGGAIVNRGGGAVLTLTNSTVSGNTSGRNGGGIYNAATATLLNVTVTANSAVGAGGGIRQQSGTMNVKNSIVAGNPGSNCSNTVTSQGYNLENTNTCGFNQTGDRINTSPLLGALASNGGPTQTHALLAGSPAIDGGTNTGAPATDQRGQGRPVDGDLNGTSTTDIGAFEYVVASVTVNSTGDAPDTSAGNGVCNTGGTIGGNPECTLRAAIQEANASATIGAIRFNIPAALTSGTHLIAPSSALPDVTAPVTIDASTEPDFTGTPVVTLSGQSSGFVTGLTLGAAADGSVIRGLVIRDWGLDGIQVAPGNDGSTIAGNYIGRLNVSGTDSGAGTENNNAGIWLRGGTTVVGGASAADRNVISGNGTRGIVLTGEAVDGVRIENNHIGVTAAATALLGNGDDAIRIENGADGTQVLGNVIAHPNGDGIEVTSTGTPTTGLVVQRNHIGTNAALTATWTGRYSAISLESGAADSLIGGTGAGDGNVIRNAGSNAGNPNSISIWSTAGSGISILGNSLAASRGIGIDLNPIGVTANDAGDGDSGPNDLLNTPVIASANESGGTVTVVFDLDVPANADQYRVEFFRNPSGVNVAGNHEAETFVSAVTTGPGTGLTHTFAGSTGDVITATATRIDSGAATGFSSTSEVSAARTVTVSSSVTVNSTGNGSDTNPGNGVCSTGGIVGGNPECTLRAAIQEANASGSVAVVRFAIPSSDPNHQASPVRFRIPVPTLLPAITDPVTIDATTQPEFAGAGRPVVVLDGTGMTAGDPNGLTLEAGGSTVRGLVIQNFADDGIEIDVNGGNTIVGNYIGTDVTGTLARPNAYGVSVKTNGNVVGGTTAADRNVIAGNTAFGVGIYDAASGNEVIGNLIGLGATGGALGNGGHGIDVWGGASANVIGGTTAGAANTITANGGDGVSSDVGAGVDNAILGNGISGNADLGIDLQNDGVTTNDAGDGDTGANDRLNFPVLTGASPAGSNLDVSFTLDVPAGNYRIELFSNPSGVDPTGYGEGESFAGAVTVSHGGGGSQAFVATIPGAPGDILTATATEDLGAGTYGSTSELSKALDASTGAWAIWRRNGQGAPYASRYAGATFGTATATASVGQFRVMQAAESPTREEVVVVGVDAGGTIAGERWDGSTWSALPALGSTTETFWWSADVAYESLTGDAVVVYADGSALSHRVWNGSTWSAEASITPPVTGTPRQLQLVASPISDEMVLIVSNDTSQDYAVVWDGSTWGNAVTLAAVGTGNDRTDVSVAYEAVGGRAVAVYGAGTDSVHYRIWDGSSWGGEQVLAGIGGGYARWTTLASDPTTDRIALGVVTNDADVWLAVWNGTAWVDRTTATLNTTGTNHPAVAVAFESVSGQAIATYGESVTTPRYRTWSSGTGWSAQLSAPPIGATPNSQTLSPDPHSDRVMLAVQDASSDLHYLRWDGSAWGVDNELEVDTAETKNQPFVFVWDAPRPTVPLPPIAVDDSAATTLDTPVDVDVLANDSDPNGDPLTIQSVTQGSNGTVTNNGSDVTYTPGPGWTGTDTFTYTISDGNGGTDTATVTVTVTDAFPSLWLSTAAAVGSPSGAPGLASWSQGAILEFADPGFAFEPPVTAGTFSLIADLNAQGDGNVVLTGLDLVESAVTVGGSPSVALQDGDLLLSTGNDETFSNWDASTTAIKAEDVVLFRPRTAGDYTSGTFSVLLAAPLGGVADFSLVEQTTTVGDTTLPAGSFLLADADIVYRLTPTAAGPAVSPGTPTVLVDGPDVAIDQNIVGLHVVDRAVRADGVDLFAGDLLISIDNTDAAVGDNGIPVVRQDVFRVRLTRTTAGAGTASGDATLLFDGSDVGLDTNNEDVRGVVLLGGTPISAPVAVADAVVGMRNAPLVVAPLVNDADPNGDPLSIQSFTQPTNGTVADNGDGTVTYTPVAGFAGTDAFTYTVTDGIETDTATVNVDVRTPELRIATSDVVVGSGTPGVTSWTTSDLLSVGDPSFTLDPPTTSGTFGLAVDLGRFSADGVVRLTAVHRVTHPVTIGSGGGSFGLEIGDLVLAVTDTETMTGDTTSVTVANKDVFVFRPTSPGAPAQGGEFFMLLDDPAGGSIGALTIVERDTIVGDTVVEAGAILLVQSGWSKSVALWRTTSTGELTTGGTLSELAALDDVGLSGTIDALDLVERRITAGGRALAEGTILASTDGETTVAGLPVQRFDVFGVTISQTTLRTGTTMATASLVFDGSDTALDDNTEDPTALSLFAVPDVATGNTAPVAVDDAAATGPEQSIVIDVLANDDDIDLDILTVEAVTNGANGIVAINGDGTVTYTRNALFVGTDSFGYRINDGNGATDTAIVTITAQTPTGALAVWRNSGSTTPQYSVWNGTAFGPSLATVNVGEWRIVEGAEAPTRNEALVVGVDVNRVITGARWNGSTWAALPFNPMATVTAATWWGFDVEYESLSGDAMLVWNNGTTGTAGLSYRVWNGSTWSAAQTITTPLSGEPQHLRLVPDPRSDSMLLIASNSTSQDYALVWDGTTWGNAITLSPVGTGDARTDVNAAWQTDEGNVLVVYGKGSTSLYTRTWDGFSWSSEASITPPSGSSGTARWTTMATDPGSDRTALAVVTSASSVWFAVHDGTSWGSKQLATTAAYSAAVPNAAISFETHTGDVLATYGIDDNSLRYRTLPAGGSWSAELIGPNIGNKPTSMELYPDPNGDRTMVAVNVSDNDLDYVLWDGAAWRTPYEPTTNTGEIGNQPFEFLWASNPGVPRPTYVVSGTVFEDLAGDVLSDGTIGDATNPGAANVDVHLYRDADGDGVAEATDTFVETVQTAVDGTYAFSGRRPDKFFVVVDSTTVAPTAGLTGGAVQGDVWAEQTYGPAASDCADGGGGTTITGTAGACYGGRRAATSDSLGTWYSGAEHITRVVLTDDDVAAVDFGFSFDVVTNVVGGDTRDDDVSNGRTVQGSLRQFVQNANAVSGPDAMRFVPASPVGGGGVWTLPVSNQLPTVTGDATTIDGTAHALADGTTVLDTNPSGPELVVDGSGATAANGFTLTSDGNTIRDLVVGGFDDSFRSGVLLQGADANVVAGLYVGTNAVASAANANRYGVRIDGGSSGNVIGGSAPADRNVVSGNLDDGISVSGGGSDLNVVRGNYIGTNRDGTAAVPNHDGIDISGGAVGTVVGGTTAGDRNVISGNTFQGVFVTSDSTSIRGNHIGTNAAGDAPLGNLRGVWISGGDANVVGGSDPGSGNVISGNTFGGVLVANSATGNVVAGNRIGTDAAGTGAIPNTGSGVQIDFSATGNVVGGTAAGAGNVIANNTGDGVAIRAAATVGNAVVGNEIFGNGQLGIDLDAVGVTPNDAGDADTGANDVLNFPEIVRARRVAGLLVVDVALDAPAGDYRIELFGNTAADPSGHGEGETFLGGAAVTHTGSGSETFTVGVASGPTLLTATATEDLGGGAFGSTSELSLAVPSPDLVVVNSTGDGADAVVGDGQCDTGGPNASGAPECTLRAAIQEANDPTTPVDTIWFDIPVTDGGHGAGVWTIGPTSALPAITGRVTIDGSTQPGTVVNTAAAPLPLDGLPSISIDGGGSVVGDGLAVQADASEIRGLVIGGFAGAGSSGVEVQADAVTIAGNVIGTDPTGTTANANADGVVVNGSGTIIGGTDPADRNLIAGSQTDQIRVAPGPGTQILGNVIGADAATNAVVGSVGSGVRVVSGAAVVVGTASAPNVIGAPAGADGVVVAALGATVAANLIGTDATFTHDLGGRDGIVVSGATADVVGNVVGNWDRAILLTGAGAVVTGNAVGVDPTGATTMPNGVGVVVDGTAATIGGVGPGDPNQIAANTGDGIATSVTDATILSNRIWANGGLGIDVGDDGVTANTAADSVLNHPRIAGVTASGGLLTVEYTFDGPAGDHRIELFANPSGADPSGHGEGETLVLVRSLVSHPGGAASYTAVLPGSVGDVISTTATVDAGGGSWGATSEFSNAVVAVAPAALRVDDRSARRSDVDAAGGAPTHVAGAVGGALDLDGVDDRLVGPGLDVTDGALSMSARVRLDTSVGTQSVISKRNSAGATLYALAVDAGTGEAVATVRLSGTPVSARGGSVGTGAWHQLDASWDGTELVLFVDGAEVDRVAATGVLGTDVTTDVTIGARDDGTQRIDGRVDEVAIGHAPLDAATVAVRHLNVQSPTVLVTVGDEQTGVPGAWTADTGQSRSGTYSLSAPETSGPGVAAWAVATGIDEPGVVFESWWWLTTDSGIDVAAGTRAGSTPIDQLSGAATGSPFRWELRHPTGSGDAIDATSPDTATTGAWVEVEMWTDQLGSSRLVVDGSEVVGWTPHGGGPASGSLGLAVDRLPVGQQWRIDDARARKLVVPEPVATLRPLDRG